MEQTPTPPQSTEPPQSSSVSTSTPSTSSAGPSSQNPNPSQNPQPSIPNQQQQLSPLQNSQTRPPFNRTWPQMSSSSPSSMAAPLSQRGGLAIGVPFGQQFGGLGRNSVSVPESSANSNASPVCFLSQKSRLL